MSLSKICTNGSIFIEQINNRWSERDKSKDDADNPYILPFSSKLGSTDADAQWLCDQLIAYARNNVKGSNRLSFVSIGNQIASSKYISHKWRWYSQDDDDNIIIGFSNKNENSIPYDIPILFASGNQWDQVIPFFDDIDSAMQKRSKTTDMYRIACRLSELGFYTGKVLPDGQQGLPVTAIVNMQDFMGLYKQPYNPFVHQELWKELQFSK